MTPSTLPVSVHGFTWTAALVGLLNAVVVGALVALIKVWPRIKELGINQRKDDLDDMRARISELEKKVDKANEEAGLAKDAANIIQMQMVSMQAAFELVAGELEKADPENKVLKQARRLLAQAATADLGVTAGFRKIASRDVKRT